MKTLRLMLLSVLSMLCGTTFATEVTWEASSGDPLTTIFADSNIKLVWEEGSGDMSPRYDGQNVYFDAGNRVNVCGNSNDVVISQVVFTFADNRYSMVTCDKKGKNISTTGIVNNSSAYTSTWTGEANSIFFRAPQGTGSSYRRLIASIAVTYTGGTSGPVEQKAVLAITQDNIATTYDMDVNPVFVVYYENQGNKAAENAKLTLYVDNVENASKEIGTLAIGSSAQNFWNAKYDVSKFNAGEHQVKLTLTADDAETVSTEVKTVTFTKAAPEATFTVAANNVNVAHDATSYQVAATVTNTSEAVNATGVQVLLQRSLQDVAEPQSIDLAAGEIKDVIFTVTAPEGGFTAGTTSMFVMVKAYDKYKAQHEVTVTVEEAPVEEVKDLALISIDGQIDLGVETPQLRVIVQNYGTVDITDAPVVLKNGESLLGQGTISAKAGQAGWAYISVDKTGLEAGTINVTATVTVEDDTTPVNNSLETEITIVAAPVPQAAFTLTAENVQTQVGDATFEVKVKVKNTGEAAGVASVKIVKGTEALCEAKSTQSLEVAGEEVLTFTVNNPYTAAGSYDNIQAMTTDNMAGCFVNVAVAPAPEEEVKDLALISIDGQIDLGEETPQLRVIVQNYGTVDITDAPVVLKNGESLLGQGTISAKAGQAGWAYISVDKTGFEAGTITVAATVTVEDDATPVNNSLETEITVVAAPVPQAAFTLTAEDAKTQVGEATFTVKVKVKNTGEAAGVATVKIIKGTEALCEAQSTQSLEVAGEEVLTFTVTNPYTAAGSYDNIQAMTTDNQAGCFVNVTVAPKPEEDPASGIATIEAQLKDKDAQIYTMKGEKVSTVSKPGLYIINGKKVVIQ